MNATSAVLSINPRRVVLAALILVWLGWFAPVGSSLLTPSWASEKEDKAVHKDDDDDDDAKDAKDDDDDTGSGPSGAKTKDTKADSADDESDSGDSASDASKDSDASSADSDGDQTDSLSNAPSEEVEPDAPEPDGEPQAPAPDPGPDLPPDDFGIPVPDAPDPLPDGDVIINGFGPESFGAGGAFVLGANFERGDVSGGALANTGFNSKEMLVVAGMLVALGATSNLVARRRELDSPS